MAVVQQTIPAPGQSENQVLYKCRRASLLADLGTKSKGHNTGLLSLKDKLHIRSMNENVISIW